MKSMLRRLASTRLTLVGMALLAIGAGLSYDNPADISVWVLVVPLAFLALNLFSAIVTLPGINRRPGLLTFHIGLLTICVLVAIGRLTVYEGRVELLYGTAFDASLVDEARQGVFHQGNLNNVTFTQGPYTVEYGPELTRGPTRSQVAIPDGRGGWDERVMGDDTPLIIDGFRFYTTFNKGFAPLLTWMPNSGEALTGAVHMPSYPLFEYKQANDWFTPEGEELKLWLRLTTAYDEENSWVLDGDGATAVLVVTSGEQRVELSPGEVVSLKGGRLRYEALSTWMGYKIYYDPTLFWLFVAAVLTVCGLMQHYWTKFANQPLRQNDGNNDAQVQSASELKRRALV
ncbi:cytochrome c biogenesis protein ResB [Pseudomonadota bacterium]